MKENNDHIGLMILHYLERKLMGHDLHHFYEWLGANDKNRQEYEEVKSIYDEREAHVDLNDGWARLSLKMTKHDAARRKVKRLRWIAGIAATLCLMLIIGLVFLRHSASPPTSVTYITGNSSSRLDLPDGSKVRLAPNSQLVYSTDYGKQTREVTLQGEAYFAVKKDTKRPFSVSSESQTIIVTGTQFNVCSYPNEKEFTTTLKEGSIRFESKAFNKSIDLRPGEQIRFNYVDGSITVCPASFETELAWLENKHVFKDAPLSEILTKMGHVYNCEFTCEDLNINQMSYTGTFYDTDSLGVFLNVIQTLTGLKATKNEDGTKVTLHT